MDPVSIFEDALKGLATKDLDADFVASAPKPIVHNEDYFSHNSQDGLLKNERSKLGALIIDAPPVSAPKVIPAYQPPGTSENNDIIMSALINAGITPSSLCGSNDVPHNSKVPQIPSRSASPNVKVLGTSGGRVLKIVSSPRQSPLTAQQLPRMASQLLRRPNSVNVQSLATVSPHVPNIIRKRLPPPTNAFQPSSKIRRTATSVAAVCDETEQFGTANALLHGSASFPTVLNGWHENSKAVRHPMPFHNPRLPLSMVNPSGIPLKVRLHNFCSPSILLFFDVWRWRYVSG